MSPLFEESLRNARVVRFKDYDYFIHPLTDGVPEIAPDVLSEVAQRIVRIADLDVDKIVTAEAMGIPIATALSLAAGVPFTIVRKRKYGLPGEVEIGQETGYAKGSLYLNGVDEGDRVLVVDDVVSTGGTLEPLLNALARIGAVVKDVVVLVEKNDGKARVERACGVQVKALARIDIRDGVVHVEPPSAEHHAPGHW